MRKTPLSSMVSSQAAEPAIAVSRLTTYVSGWLLSCELAQHSPSTLQTRRWFMDKLLSFMNERRCAECSVVELREFLHLLSGRRPGGRQAR